MSRVLLVRLIAVVAFALCVFANKKIKNHEFLKVLTAVGMGSSVMFFAATL